MDGGSLKAGEMLYNLHTKWCSEGLPEWGVGRLGRLGFNYNFIVPLWHLAELSFLLPLLPHLQKEGLMVSKPI